MRTQPRSEFDQFFTPTKTVRWCLEQLRPFLPRNPLYVEPSAGDGAFSSLLTPVTAYDLNPLAEGIRRTDFLTVRLVRNTRRVVVGNPPYGRQSELAVRFLNHAASLSDTIAFILPPTFRKWSIQSRIDSTLSLVLCEDVPSQRYYTPDGSVITNHRRVFQIWQRGVSPNLRIIDQARDVSRFIEYTTPELATIAVRRVGGRAGQVLVGLNYSTSSTYFIKAKVPWIAKAIREYDFHKVATSTVSVRSVSKSEIASAIIIYARRLFAAS
jgi:hypothetical protein